MPPCQLPPKIPGHPGNFSARIARPPQGFLSSIFQSNCLAKSRSRTLRFLGRLRSIFSSILSLFTVGPCRPTLPLLLSIFQQSLVLFLSYSTWDTPEFVSYRFSAQLLLLRCSGIMAMFPPLHSCLAFATGSLPYTLTRMAVALHLRSAGSFSLFKCCTTSLAAANLHSALGVLESYQKAS